MRNHAIDRGPSTHATGEGHSPARYLGVSAAAVYLSLSKKAIYHRVARRTIPFIKRGKRVFFDSQALDRWMRRGRVDATEPLRVSTSSSGSLCCSEAQL